MRSRMRCLVALAVPFLAAATLPAQLIIGLKSVIGPPGTNAATVSGVGLAVNFTGVAANAGATSLLAPGSTGASAFDFNAGFTDTLDRTTGSTAGAPNVFVDLKYDSSTTSPLILDTNADGSFGGEPPLIGFGMHSDTFITFDLDVIRSGQGLPAQTPFTLAGVAGIANTTLAATSAAIILDGGQLAAFDWNGPTNTLSSFSLPIPGTARYLTFAALSGLDFDNFFAHVGFAGVQLQVVPEPPPAMLLLAGLGGVAWIRSRRRGR